MNQRRTKAAPAPGVATHPGFAPLPASLVGTPVVFVRDHRHAGRDYREGDTFMAQADEIELLRHFGVIEAG